MRAEIVAQRLPSDIKFLDSRIAIDDPHGCVGVNLFAAYARSAVGAFASVTQSRSNENLKRASLRFITSKIPEECVAAAASTIT